MSESADIRLHTILFERKVTVLFSLTMALIVSSLVTQATVFSTTIFLHRTATHKSLELHPAIAWLFKLILWLTTGIITREWVGVHLKHHAFTDVEGDPHSPLLLGFWRVQVGNVFHYIRTAKNPEVVERYARDIKDDWWDRNIFRFSKSGPVLGVVLLCLMLGIGWGLFAAGLHLIMYVFVLSSSINGLCHTWGYKNFNNTATNVRVVALLTGGEGLHNNHHGHPRSPKLSWGGSGRKLEIDPAWAIVKILVWLKLAKPYKTIEEMVYVAV